MKKCNPIHVGFAVGAVFGLLHAVWSVKVAAGTAQVFINWIFRLHMIQPPYQVLPFSLGTAVMLVIVTAIIGFIIGAVFAWVWNRITR